MVINFINLLISLCYSLICCVELVYKLKVQGEVVGVYLVSIYLVTLKMLTNYPS